MNMACYGTHAVRFAALAALVAGGAGCSAITTRGGGETADAQARTAVQQASAPAPSAGSITVELRPHRKKAEMRSVSLETGMTVQPALERSGAVKRFRRMNIKVMRVTGQERNPLEVKYDHADRSVNPLYDYALHPGDHLVITEDVNNSLDDMLNSISGAVGLNDKP